MATAASPAPSPHATDLKTPSSERVDSATDTPATSPLHQNATCEAETGDRVEDLTDPEVKIEDMTTLGFADPIDLTTISASPGGTTSGVVEDDGVEEAILDALHETSGDDDLFGASTYENAHTFEAIDAEESREPLNDNARDGFATSAETPQDQSYDASSVGVTGTEELTSAPVHQEVSNATTSNAVPATTPRKQTLMLTLKPKKLPKPTKPPKQSKKLKKSKQPTPSTRRPARASAAVGNGTTDSFTTEAPATTRSGRKLTATKKMQGTDMLAGLELDAHMNAALKSSPPRRSDDGDDDFVGHSSPPVVSKFTKRRPGRPFKDRQPATIIEEPSPPPTPSSTAASEPATPAPGSGHGPFFALINKNLYENAEELETLQSTLLDLPDFQNENQPDTQYPWTAERLTHLYLIFYHKGNYDMCDLIADTWCRTFHRLNKGPESRRIWRPRTWVKDKDEKAPLPQWILESEDPQLHWDVTDFNPTLLNQLYFHTPRHNGARMLWADAMALCGDKIEHQFEKIAKHKQSLHPDLVYNVGCTALRLTRRRLTLKIEESAEDSWCGRYHLHPKEADCYRKKAKAAWIAEKRAEKRAAEVMEDAETSQPKRVQYTNGRGGLEQMSNWA